MSIEKCLDFTNGYNRKSDESTPTTRGDMYRFVGNQNNVLMNLASGLWQPSTAYAVGASVTSPAIPAGCIARCVTAGTSSEAEPTWPAKGKTVADGTVKWLVEDTVLSNIMATVNNALASLHSTITAEVKKSMLALFPVGTIIESLKDVNPGTYIGGTWGKMPAGYVTISAGTYSETQAGTAKTYTFNAGSTYGEAAHKLTVGEMPSHEHGIQYGTNELNYLPQNSTRIASVRNGNTVYQPYINGVITDIVTGTYSSSGHIIETVGGSQYHNNLQPSVGVYRYKRVS